MSSPRAWQAAVDADVVGVDAVMVDANIVDDVEDEVVEAFFFFLVVCAV
jgi:hypothetical protein